MTSTTLPSGTGVVSTYSYDNADRLTAISHDQGGTTLASASYTLDNVGNRTQRVDQAGTHSYAYDNVYRLTSVTYPGPTTTSYAFDAFGNRTSKTDAGGTTTYAYNDDSRLTTVTPPNPAPAVSYTWDNNGNLTARGSDSFAWDVEDRMTSATVGGTSTTFAYRGDGLRDSRTTGGVTTTFTWDIAAGLPVVLDDGAQYVYGANGLVAQVSGANTYYYLADGLGSTMKTVDATGTVVNAYTYDVYGKVATSSGTQANEFQFAGQQTDATGLHSSVGCAFDAFGNRTSKTDAGGTTAYAYNDDSRLTTVTPPNPAPAVSYTWDNNGNLTNRGTDTFAWDVKDRMTSATVGGTSTTFAYRGDGLRDSRTTGGVTTTFTWDIAAGLPVVLDDGAQYVYGASGLVAQVAGANTYYYLADGLGSTMKTVDASGTVVNAYTYDVYGKVVTSSGAQANEFQFAGQQTDGTGLQYLRARYYDPDTGTFLSRDPLASEPIWSASAYAYTTANPATGADPSGLACQWFDVRCHVKEFVGATDGEEAYCMRGPSSFRKCQQSRDDANDAVTAVNTVFPGQDSDLTAAFRHCLWSGLMTCRWGSGQAQIFGDIHEAYPENPENRKQQALWNNAVGRTIGEYYRGRKDARALVQEECLRATFDGRLATSRHIFDPGGFDGAPGDRGT